MRKNLSEMTLEELWKLFPILLTEHKDCWKDWYQEEERRLAAFLPTEKIKLHHIGSTAIDGIWAKPIIDILVEISDTLSMEEIKRLLEGNGYICMSEGEKRKSFNKGYTAEGFAGKVFHLHLRYAGDCDELYFRDYLREDREAAEAYERLKLSLWKKYEQDRDGYTAAKTAFIREYTEKAKERYKGRYA